MKLDSIDRRILDLLQRDGRITNAELAERINLSPSACLRRVRRLEEECVIDGYVARINQSAIGKPCDVFIQITLNSQSEESLQAFESAVRNCPDVLECYLMSGDADYLMRVIAADTADYERIHNGHLSRLPGVARIRSNFALRTVERRSVVNLD